MLSKVSISTIMSREVKTIDPETSINEFLKMITTHQHTGFPVVSGGRIVGIITLNDAKEIPEDMTMPARHGEP